MIVFDEHQQEKRCDGEGEKSIENVTYGFDPLEQQQFVSHYCYFV
jgi:hypothetical protein